MRMPARQVAIVTAIFAMAAVTGCAAFSAPPRVLHYVHPSLLRGDGRELPEEVVLLTPLVRVWCRSAGGETVLDSVKSEEASAKVAEAIQISAKRSAAFRMRPMPELSDADRRVLGDHVLLFSTAASAGQALADGMRSAYGYGRDWRPRYEEYDCTLGSGLAFLAQQSGASGALVAVGDCVVPAAGAGVRMSVTPLGLFPEIIGAARLRIGLVDLATGDVLWTDQETPTPGMFGAGPTNLLEPKNGQRLVDRAMDKYPGIEEFRRLWAY
jgi:hypothetical protein